LAYAQSQSESFVWSIRWKDELEEFLKNRKYAEYKPDDRYLGYPVGISTSREDFLIYTQDF
jgi:hypothetical protein